MDEKREMVSIFIDGSNFYHRLRELDIEIDFRKFISELLEGRELVNVFFYVAPLDISYNPLKYWKHQKFLDQLRKIPLFNVVLCTLKKIVTKKGEIIFEVKGDDVYLANDFLKGAYENLYDTAIIVSGDEDFISIVETAKRLGKRIENACFRKNASWRLRKSCDNYKFINNLVDKIRKQKSPALP